MGKSIRTLRKQRGLTQAELAKLAGVSTISIQRYESGCNLSLSNARKIATALEITVDELINKESA